MQKRAPRSEIDVAAAALLVGAEWATFVRPFMPAGTEPTQIVKGRVGVCGTAAVGIEVFHAHDKRTAGSARALKRSPESARMTNMEIARGRGCEAAAITRYRCWG
jgi:hypothetical protein